ncbi:MAG: PAS domain-containing protein [Flavobacterium sp.]|jgi:PAS domain-containing protein
MGYFVVFFITITSLSFLVNKLEGSNLALQEKNNTTQNTLDIALDAARKFELFSNSATDIFWITDLDLNYSYISPSIEKLSGFSVDEAFELGGSGILELKELNRASEVLIEELEYDHERDPNRTVRLEMRHKKRTADILMLNWQ